MPAVAFAYHDVGPRRRGDRYTVEPELFERQLDAMREASAPVTLTFDDGGVSALDVVAPILAARGLHGSFFVITNAIGRAGTISAAGIRELRAAGHTVGSHSHTHPYDPFIRDLPDDRLDDEWRRSKVILEDILGEEVDSLSVPYGYYSARVGRSALAAGYRVLYVSDPWTEPRPLAGDSTLRGRFSVIADTPPERIAAICRLDRATLLREAASWRARKLAQRTLGRVYLSLRRSLLARRHA